jgi:hypothetical protein
LDTTRVTRGSVASAFAWARVSTAVSQNEPSARTKLMITPARPALLVREDERALGLRVQQLVLLGEVELQRLQLLEVVDADPAHVVLLARPVKP